MDGIHDLGGKHGHGDIAAGDDPLAFHERWQAAMFSIVNALLGNGTARNIDHFRHAVERIDPVSYLQDGYYGRWLGAAETLLVEAGQLTQQQITDRAVALGAGLDDRIAARPGTDACNSENESTQNFPTAQREIQQQARFTLGQRVRTRSAGVPGHTRLPSYARAATGEIIAWHGAWVYPDANAHGQGEQPQHLYTVAFSGEVLWDETGSARDEVCIDLFESYLQEVD